VEVPFYFKSIVDSMNVDFAAVGGTAYTVAGSMIIACKEKCIDGVVTVSNCKFQMVLLGSAPRSFKNFGMLYSLALLRRLSAKSHEMYLSICYGWTLTSISADRPVA
jgi:hypothetical protein